MMADRDVTPIPGWSRVEARAATIWLPESWFGGDPKRDKRSIGERAKTLGPAFQGAAEGLGRNPGPAHVSQALIAIDSKSHSTFLVVNVERLSLLRRGGTLEQYVKTGLTGLPKNIRVLEKGIVLLDGIEAGRTLVEISDMGAFGKVGSVLNNSLQFNIKGNGVFWNLTYSVAPGELGSHLPIFDQSVRTFRFDP